ncbi:hypothetical protein [Streptomyces sp. N35]|uniref:hypothetical protein n=1 Tax=Streptomyces sp. N35 TaxID=2795730 RepID=UPI0018F4E7BF|nr:hypothetical protein [Streptomyces sp. N35]
MSAVVTVIVIVAAVALIAGAVFLVTRRAGGGGRSLERRFGPEYERTVARHDGDTRAAERELDERVKQHGSLTPKPLASGEREQYETRWARAQERFVESPREAVAEVDALIAELAAERGYPGRERYEEQLSALSVHHAHQVQGYRRVHAAAHGNGEAGTESLREAMVEARALFHELLRTADGRRGRGEAEPERRPRSAITPGREKHAGEEKLADEEKHTGEKDRPHAKGEPGAHSGRTRVGPAGIFNRHRAKES